MLDLTKGAAVYAVATKTGRSISTVLSDLVDVGIDNLVTAHGVTREELDDALDVVPLARRWTAIDAEIRAVARERMTERATASRVPARRPSPRPRGVTSS